MTTFDLAFACLAAVGAGVVNALAGGGTSISFPALLALGVPPIAANVTNAVALCPGYLGATLAQVHHLQGQRARLPWCIPAAVVGGLLGGIILLHTHERTFEVLIPCMLLLASSLLAAQEHIRRAVLRRLSHVHGTKHSLVIAAVPVAAAAIYGGFSAGMSVIVLAVLGVTVEDEFARLNALKQIVAFSINVAAAACFLFSGQVFWWLAALMAVGALLGGALGGRLVGILSPPALRWSVVVIGIALAIYYWVK